MNTNRPRALRAYRLKETKVCQTCRKVYTHVPRGAYFCIQKHFWFNCECQSTLMTLNRKVVKGEFDDKIIGWTFAAHEIKEGIKEGIKGIKESLRLTLLAKKA